MATQIVAPEPIQAQEPFDITKYPIGEQELPVELRLALAEDVARLPAQGRGRPVVDEGEFLLLLAEALWCARVGGCVVRQNRLLAEDMTRRMRTRKPGSPRITSQQLRPWLSRRRKRYGERREAAMGLVWELLVEERRRTERKTNRGMRPGPAKLLLHGQDDEAKREFFRGER